MDFLQYIQWRPGIGDPSFMGWFTVFSYHITAIICALVAINTQRIFSNSRAKNQNIFWWALAVTLFLLGINKQLDLQSLLIDIGRAILISQGWYEQRRTYKLFIALVMAFTGCVFMIFIGYTLRRTLRENWLVIIGTIFLLTFILVRAAPFPYFDKVLNWRPAGIRMNWILELAGIFSIGIAAVHKIYQGYFIKTSHESIES
jgi:hypothetical protein